MSFVIHHGDALTVLRTMPSESVNCVVTSPPFWGLRDYGTGRWEGGLPDCDHVQRHGLQGATGQRADRAYTGRVPYRGECGKCGALRVDQQIGLEETPEAYVTRLVEVFREVRRVLREDGTCWLNLGDSYVAHPGQRKTTDAVGPKQRTSKGSYSTPSRHVYDLKPKDLVGIPWMVAFALQADGWVIRSEIVWHKPNPMPESVKDRPTKSHEIIFLLAKAQWSGPAPRRFAAINDQDARWLALFLDTEGNIVVKRAMAKSGRYHYGVQLCFASTSRDLLNTCQEIIGCGAILERSGKNAPMFYLQLSNLQAADLLHRLYPFLIVKKRQAQLGIHLQDVIAVSGSERRSKEGRLRGRTRSDEYTRLLESFWGRMKCLNHFGSPDLTDVTQPVCGKWAGSAKYWYDSDAIAEPLQTNARENYPARARILGRGEQGYNGENARNGDRDKSGGFPVYNGRNKRSVWTLATLPTPDAHFATFPIELPETCIKAGCPEGGTVLDPFAGAGTTGLACLKNGRNFVGIELNAEYIKIAENRAQRHYPLLMEGATA